MSKELKFFCGVYVDLKGEVVFEDKVKDKVRIWDKEVSLFISGKWRSFDREWLSLVAHYEINFEVSLLPSVKFVECHNRLLNLHCKHLMIFTRPIYYRPGFRIVPGLTKYAVNEVGDVISVFSGKLVSSKTLGPYGYPMVSCYDADKGRYRQICTHILVGRSWCSNDHPGTKIVLNHKNGIKTDLRSINLEWTTQKGNSSHARKSGLHHDSQECFLCDLKTGDKWKFDSLKEASVFMGYKNKHTPPDQLKNGVTVPLIYKERFILVRSGENVVDLIEQAKRLQESQEVDTYSIKNVKTSEVSSAKKMSSLAKVCGLTKSEIEYAFSLPSNVVYKGHQFHSGQVEFDWPDIVGERGLKKRYRIEAVNNALGIEKTFSSIRQATKYFNCDKTTIKRRLLSGDELDGYLLKEAS